MTVPERMRLMGPPCTYNANGRVRLGQMGTRGLTMAPVQWPTAVGMRGENNPKAKVTEAQVREIRRRIDGGEARKEIASDYGVRYQTVWDIGARVSWRHVTEEVA